MLGVWVVLLVVAVGGIAAIVRGAIWLWKRQGALSPLAKALATLTVVAALSGMLGATMGVVKALGAVGGQSIDPAQKARLLAEGISETMNCTAFALLVGIPGAVALAYAMRRQTQKSK